MAREIVTTKNRDEKLRNCLDLGQRIADYYRIKSDPQQLALDAEILQAYPIEHLREAFRSHLADPLDCKFPPKPGDLIKRISKPAENLGGAFTPLTEEEKLEAIAAKESPEAKRFHEVLERVGKGMKVESKSVTNPDSRKELLKRQAAEKQGK
jgi:hypothetical protein